MALYPNLYGFNANPMQSYGFNNQMTTSPKSNIVWVQGIEGAKAYSMTPNSVAALFDSEIEGRFYIKTCDSMGMCSLRCCGYKDDPLFDKKEIDTSSFVTKDELTNAINELKEGMKHEQSVSATDTKSSSTKR